MILPVWLKIIIFLLEYFTEGKQKKTSNAFLERDFPSQKKPADGSQPV